MKKKEVAELFSITVFSVVIFVLSISYLFKPFRIDGKSMEPIFREGDIVFVNRIFLKVDRNDIVVAKMSDKTYVVKRVLALEGDKIDYKEGEIFVNGENRGKITSGDYEMFFKNSSFTVEKKSCFLLGDNRSLSVDSRFWGIVPLESIYGKIIFNPFSFFRKKGLLK
ncbi:MAG: signal peptidase I [Acidobacteria bacterium]|nr:signal peptidase I [Acidobacteriota bacterium]